MGGGLIPAAPESLEAEEETLGMDTEKIPRENKEAWPSTSQTFFPGDQPCEHFDPKSPAPRPWW